MLASGVVVVVTTAAVRASTQVPNSSNSADLAPLRELAVAALVVAFAPAWSLTAVTFRAQKFERKDHFHCQE